MRARSWVAAGLFGSIVWSCAPVEHPQNAKVGDAICGPECHRGHQCDASTDETSCINRCKNGLSPRSIYWSDTLVNELTACGTKQACTNNTIGSIDACRRDTEVRFEPTASAKDFCAKAVDKDRMCGDLSSDVEHCVSGHKLYSDAILAQLTDCLDDPCRHYGRCLLAVVGPDAFNEDKDRQAAFKAKAVATARTEISLSGKVTVYGEKDPVPGAKICIHDDPKTPCATTDADGKFTMVLPAAKDLPLEVIAPAPEFAPILVGFPAHVVDATEFTIGAPRAAHLVKRYEPFGAKYPDASSGFIRATLFAPKDHVVSFDDVTVSVDPKSAGGPFAIPVTDPKSTSRTFAFSGVAPGVVEVSFGPPTLNCVPAFGAWSTGKPNVVRVPIAAGFETQVAQRCDR